MEDHRVESLLPSNTTVLCPQNDLESVTILDICKERGFDFQITGTAWGGNLDTTPPLLIEADFKPNLLLIETPGPDTIKKWRENGFKVHELDHHVYSSVDSEQFRNRPSSLEQFATLIGHELTRYQRLVAENDKAYVRGLYRAGVFRGITTEVSKWNLERFPCSDPEISLAITVLP